MAVCNNARQNIRPGRNYSYQEGCSHITSINSVDFYKCVSFSHITGVYGEKDNCHK